MPDDAFNKALAYLRNQVAATDNADYESKAILLHALAAAGQGDFALANRLYRDRPALSRRRLGLPGPGACRHGPQGDRRGAPRPAGRAEPRRRRPSPRVGPARRRRCPGAIRRPSCGPSMPWRLEEVAPKAPKAKELVDWLLAHRTGHRWSPDKATGPAALALCRWFAESRFEGEHYKLAVFVNDVQVKVLDVDPAAGTHVDRRARRVAAPTRGQGSGSTSRSPAAAGTPTSASWAASCRPKARPSTTGDWQVEADLRAGAAGSGRPRDPPRLRRAGGQLHGVPQPAGATAGGPPRHGRADVCAQRHALGHAGRTAGIPRRHRADPQRGHGRSRTRSRAASSGSRSAPGAITFYVGNRRYLGTIHYELCGYVPGKYRAAPTVVRNAHRPEQLAGRRAQAAGRAAAGRRQPADAYRLTPQELYELGKRHFEQEGLPPRPGTT